MHTAYPKISIVIPSLNQGKFIEATIQSVLSQEYPNLELLVFDGGSSDETLSILEKYTDQLHWVSQKDNGQAEAINRGLRAATGEIVTYLNTDDLLLPGSLAQVAREFVARPGILWLAGRCRIINAEGHEIRQIVTLYKNLLLLTGSRHVLLAANYISQPATFWRRCAMEKAGWLDESLYYMMDYDYWLRLWNLKPPRLITRKLAAFRVHAQSKTISGVQLEQYTREEEQVLARHTHSRFWRGMNALHRWAIITLYAYLNG